MKDGEEGRVVGDKGNTDPNGGLERRKLKLEIAALQCWYFRPPFLSVIATLITAGLTAWALYYSGFFDAKRAQLQVERAGLQLENEQLNQRKGVLYAQITGLQEQVSQLQNERDKLVRLFQSSSHESEKSRKDLGSCLAQLENVKTIVQAGNQAAARPPDSPPAQLSFREQPIPDELTSITDGVRAAGEAVIQERADLWRKKLGSSFPPYHNSGEKQDSYVSVGVADPQDYRGLRSVLASLGYNVHGFTIGGITSAVRDVYFCRIGPLAKKEATRLVSQLRSSVEDVRLESMTR